MASRDDAADFSPLVSRSSAREQFGKAVRLYVGRGKRYSVKQLSNGTGIPDRVIECAICDPYSEEYREPKLDAILSLSAFLGPEFTTEWLKLADQGAFRLPDVEDTPPGALAADNAEDNATLTRAAIDGKFDPEEAPDLRKVGTRLMVRGAQLRAVAP